GVSAGFLPERDTLSTPRPRLPAQSRMQARIQSRNAAIDQFHLRLQAAPRRFPCLRAVLHG
ncbi:MAG: hypothetical protein LC732_02625, partial [Acidobacteria bacterium]|nr:hypothetical protein [Acidobacteriota bacterium]